MIIRELSASQCQAVLMANRLARLACARDGQPYAVPIFYAYADGCAYAFTMPGRKLETMRANPNAALLIEQNGPDRCWKSVVAEGCFEELPGGMGFHPVRDHAWSLLSEHANWWEPGALKPTSPPLADRSSHVFFRIRIERISGREAVEE
jgi:nitroimidazol reductase NimA-like FMN-containing flavoprotein (pyridoxamine 5'-phosphate oxidase superfamily)